MIAASRIVDSSGNPFASPKKAARPELVDALLKAQKKLGRNRGSIDGTYDASRDSDEFKNYWANADFYDADSANSRPIRSKLVSRSRYEIANNGYADGIAQTYATDLVGIGPKLRMQTGSAGFNQLVEAEWDRWAKAIQLRRKLWCMAHAKIVDGEAIAVARTNPRVNHQVKIDLVLYETEQCQTPALAWELIRANGFNGGYCDGIRFDEFGNPIYYDILRRHPGSTAPYADLAGLNFEPEQVEARYVLHWYMLRRPGQHRGVPELTSTLNVGAASRRWREATLGAAETAADFSILLKTLFQPDEIDQVAPLSTLDIQKRMMTAMPAGWDATQMKAEHPNASYEAFHKAQINEQARAKSMPYNKAACDSSSYNYASGRLDHQTYYGALDVDREDGNDLALDRLFPLWFNEAVRAFSWLGGNPDALSPYASLHSWDWPKHQVADIQAEAAANDKNLRNGSLSLTRLYAENGEDFEDELPVIANDYFGGDQESGMTQDERNQEMRKIVRNSIFNNQSQQASMATAEAQSQGAASGDSSGGDSSATEAPQTLEEQLANLFS